MGKNYGLPLNNEIYVVYVTWLENMRVWVYATYMENKNEILREVMK